MGNRKLENAITAKTAKCIYDFIGKANDRLGAFDIRAKWRALSAEACTRKSRDRNWGWYRKNPFVNHHGD
jgi:hypothetical protein